VTTAADGSATAYSPFLLRSDRCDPLHQDRLRGRRGLHDHLRGDRRDDLWTESDVNAAKVSRPRAATNTTAGVASLYASGGTAVNDLIRLSRDRVKIVIAAGGNVKSGAFHVVTEE
jgi:hypothetical protein